MLRVISSIQADRLGWHKGERAQKIIRACFYLGYGDAFIQEIVANPMRSKEADIIIESAEELGMTDNDEVSISPVSPNLAPRGRRDIERSTDHPAPGKGDDLSGFRKGLG